MIQLVLPCSLQPSHLVMSSCLEEGWISPLFDMLEKGKYFFGYDFIAELTGMIGIWGGVPKLALLGCQWPHC